MSSRAASAQYGVACPTCGATANQPCRSRTKCRVTDTHAARITAAYPACRDCGCQKRTHPIDTCRAFVHPESDQ